MADIVLPLALILMLAFICLAQAWVVLTDPDYERKRYVALRRQAEWRAFVSRQGDSHEP